VNAGDLVGLITSVFVLAYLLVVLVNPERF